MKTQYYINVRGNEIPDWLQGRGSGGDGEKMIVNCDNGEMLFIERGHSVIRRQVENAPLTTYHWNIFMEEFRALCDLLKDKL